MNINDKYTIDQLRGQLLAEIEKNLRLTRENEGLRQHLSLVKQYLFARLYGAEPSTIREMLDVEENTVADWSLREVEEKVVAAMQEARREVMVSRELVREANQMMREASPSLTALAKSDAVLTLMIANPNVKQPEKYWVEIVKNRYGNRSKHAFHTLLDALDFIEEWVGE